jgi:transposase InsO family protein
MNVVMKNITIERIEEIKEFNRNNDNVNFLVDTRKDRYQIISDTLLSVRYPKLGKKDKGRVKEFLERVTSYSSVQIKRLICQWRKNGLPYTPRRTPRTRGCKYIASDIGLLIKTDAAHKTPNGKAVKKLLERQLLIFGKEEYARIANISVSHMYNIRRNSRQYLSSEAIRYTKTNPVSVNIGERRKPHPYGKPGFLRVDSVHQGDFEGEKGIYHINIVDEVTQWEMVGSVEAITCEYLIPLLREVLDTCPFRIINFHSDNGSEYINAEVSKMLKQLFVGQTKSRSRRTNDQALVESKNGAVIRKHMGRNHIPKEHAPLINEFYRKWFNPYLNYHRVCLYATDYTDKRGKIRKRYDIADTPHERLKSLPNAEQYLKWGISFKDLGKVAYEKSDTEFAEMMEKAKIELIKKIKRIKKSRQD